VNEIQAPTTEHLLEMSVHCVQSTGYLLDRFLSPKTFSSTKSTEPLVAALDADCIDTIVPEVSCSRYRGKPIFTYPLNVRIEKHRTTAYGQD
jgi:hypothetical protein